MRAYVVFLVVVSLGCESADAEESIDESTEAVSDPRSRTVTPWGTDLWTPAPDSRPNDFWPGVFDQPKMTDAGACGFAALANLTAQLVSLPGEARAPVSPWDALASGGYNTVYGIHPDNAIAKLDTIFEDAGLVGDEMRGTRFAWHHEGYGNAGGAWDRLQGSLRDGKPFIALVNYGNATSWSLTNWTFSSNHYVVVVKFSNDHGITIAHWGGYEDVKAEEFMRWWENHSIWSFAGIYPSRASQLTTAAENGQSRRNVSGGGSF
jgi:hypothetical protein